MLLDDMVDYLTSGGLANDGTTIMAGLLREQPDLALVVCESGGRPPTRAMRASPGQPAAEMPRIQVVARAGQYDYTTARAKIDAAYKLLEGFGDRTINGCFYEWIGAVQSPFLMGRDDAGRPMLACNFDVVKQLSTS